MQRPLKRSPLQGDNLRETLIIHFANLDGLIIGKHTTRALVDIGYFSTRRAADGAVYTTLGKSPFQKFDRGIYIIPTDSPEWNTATFIVYSIVHSKINCSNGYFIHIFSCTSLKLL